MAKKEVNKGVEKPSQANERMGRNETKMTYDIHRCASLNALKVGHTTAATTGSSSSSNEHLRIHCYHIR